MFPQDVPRLGLGTRCRSGSIVSAQSLRAGFPCCTLSLAMGLFGPPNVARLEARRQIPKLIKALDYRGDDFVCTNAADALGRLGAVEAVGRLAVLCRIGHDRVGPAAVEALERIGAASTDDSVRSTIIAALIDAVESSGPGGPQLTCQHDDDFEANRCRARYESSKVIFARSWNEGLHRRSVAAAALRRFPEPRVVEALLACLERHHEVVRDFHTRRAAAESLGAIKDARAIPGLEAALHDQHEDVRHAASLALRAITRAQNPTLSSPAGRGDVSAG